MQINKPLDFHSLSSAKG